MTESKLGDQIYCLYYAESSRYSQAKFQDSLTLPFEQVLPEAVIQKILKEGVSYRQTLYTPIVTLWAWMSQVLDSDKV